MLFVFVTAHFINHTLGNISLGAMEAGREVFTALWRNWPATILFYGAILVHALATLGVHEFFGVNDSYLYEILKIWVFEPLYGWLAALAGGYGCIGLHQWLRLKPWYSRACLWLLTAALLLPALALSGFASVGKQIALWTQN